MDMRFMVEKVCYNSTADMSASRCIEMCLRQPGIPRDGWTPTSVKGSSGCGRQMLVIGNYRREIS
jgi:hypothetical protein